MSESWNFQLSPAWAKDVRVISFNQYSSTRVSTRVLEYPYIAPLEFTHTSFRGQLTMLRVLLGSLMGALCIGLATAGSCDAPIQLSTALSLVNVMQQLTTKIDNLKAVTEAKFKDILTPDTGTAPTLSNTAGLSFQPVTFTLGVKCWTDRADYKYTQAPAYRAIPPASYLDNA